MQLLWYRTDKELCASVLFVGVVVGSLAYAAQAVFARQDEARKRIRQLHDTVCGVVYEKSAFSWTEFRALPEPGGEEWQRAWKVAEAVYFGRHAPALGGARFFHAAYVNPDWAKEKRRVARIGNHVFYR